MFMEMKQHSHTVTSQQQVEGKLELGLIILFSQLTLVASASYVIHTISEQLLGAKEVKWLTSMPTIISSPILT